MLVSEPDPRKIEKEGLAHRRGWKCTLRPVWRRTSDWLLISILMCVYCGNANRTRTVFAFCFVLGSCKRQAGKIERLYWCLVQQKTLQTLQGSAIKKIPNIPQCALPPWPMCQTLLFDFSRVWFRDCKCYVGHTAFTAVLCRTNITNSHSRTRTARLNQTGGLTKVYTAAR